MNGRSQRGDRARAKILSHSTLIASVAGLEGLSIGRVAAEAGVGKGNIQVLFGDKEALQLATLEEAVNLYDAAVVVPAMKKKTPVAKLLALVEGWFDFVESRALPGGCFMNAVSNEYRTRPGRIRDQIGKYRSTIRNRLRKLIVEAKEAGELRADLDVEQLAFDLIASEAAANIAALMGDARDFERAQSTSLDRVRAGMTSSHPKRTRRQSPRLT